jgi:hypothetical protein
MGGELDGGGSDLPLRAMGRAGLRSGAGEREIKFLVAAVALWRLARAAEQR